LFPILCRNVDNKLPGDTASHLSSKDTDCCWSHPEWNWWFSGRHDAEGIEAKNFKWILGKKYVYMVW